MQLHRVALDDPVKRPLPFLVSRRLDQRPVPKDGERGDDDDGVELLLVVGAGRDWQGYISALRQREQQTVQGQGIRHPTRPARTETYITKGVNHS